MGDKNPIRTLGDYSRPSHEGYQNTIELPDGNNVVPLRSDTIWLVQNGCSFHGLRSEDPNQHLKDFLKLVDSLDLDVANRERKRLHLFQFFLRDLASNWLECESLSEALTRFKDLLQKLPHHGIDLWLQVQIFYDHVNSATRRTIDQSAGGKLRDKNAEEIWALLEDLAFYDNESWNDPKDFAKPVKAISLPQDVPSTSECRLIELESQAINDRMTGALPSDTVKNPKLNDNFTSPVLSARSYPTEDPQCSSYIHNSINAIKTCSKQPNENDQLKIKTLTVNEIGTPKLKEPEQPLDDEFKDVHLNLPVLEVLAHAPMYNAILDKYVESLELGKNLSVFIQGEMPKKMKDPELSTLSCRLRDSKPFDTLADLGSRVNLIPLYIFKKVKIGLLEETNHVFGLANV
ncbi:hypothetical protein Tco_1379109 [Tanacetum coccineum]